MTPALLAYRMVVQPVTPPSFKVPSVVWFGGHATGGALTSSGTLAGDLFIGIDVTNTTTPPASPPTGCTTLGTASSDESLADRSIAAAWKIATGANEGVAANGTGRRVWVALRDVDTANFASLMSNDVTYAFANTSGASYIVPALGTFPRDGVVLTFGTYSNNPDVDFGTTLIIRQNSGAGPSQAYKTSGEVASFSGESPAISSDRARCALSVWIPGAPE